MVYVNCIIYGPYKSNQDGRSRIFLKWPDGKSTTISYAKFLMEKKLNRYLSYNEEVHHIDENPTNDSIENLEVLKRSEHKKRHIKGRAMITTKCSCCSKEIKRELRYIRKGQINIFCSKKCSGKYNQFM